MPRLPVRSFPQMSSQSASTALRILLVDDHSVVRRGIRAFLEEQPGWEVCGEGDNGAAGIRLAGELLPSVAVLDVSLPDMNGMELLRGIKKASANTEVIFLTGHAAEDLVHAAFDAGARSYMLKIDDPADIIAAVAQAAQHKPFFTPWVSGIIYNRLSAGGGGQEKAAPGSMLTVRERQTVRLVAEGKTNKDVAAELGVSVRTAEAHRAALMRKLGLHTVGEVVRFAIRNGIVEA